MRSALVILVVVVVSVALFLGLQSGKGDTAGGKGTTISEVTRGASPRPAAAATATNAQAEVRSVDREHPGYVVYTRRGCNVCHGADLTGTNMAPTLVQAGEHWNPETFARYLANPDSSARVDPRLKELDRRYSMFVMPAYSLPDEELVPLTSLILRTKD